MQQLAKENGISHSAYYGRLSRKWDKHRAATEPMRRKAKNYSGDYAVYQNDELVVMGSREECAERLGVKPGTIQWMTTPSGRKRSENAKNAEMAMVVIKMDEEDED